MLSFLMLAATTAAPIFHPASVAALGAVHPAIASSSGWTSSALVPGATQERRSASAAEQSAEALGMRDSLVAALSRVHAFDRHCLDLGLYKRNGSINTGALQRGAGPDHPIVRFLECGAVPGSTAGDGLHLGVDVKYPGVRGFHVPGLRLSLDELLECTRYHLGYGAAKAALESDPELQPEDVLATLAEACLLGTPIEGSWEATELHKRSVAQQRFAVLGNGSFCYVAWGFLQLDDFWEEAEEGAKEDFMQEVLSLGIQSDALTWMCQRVLYPALVPTEEQPGRGVARPFDSNRGVLGFTDGHQSFVEGIRNDLVSNPSAAEPKAGGAIAAETAPAEDRPRASHPRLGAWSSVMLDRILRERGTAEEADTALRNGSLKERGLYWRVLSRSASFEVFNAAYVDEITRMAKGSDGFPGAERIMALESLVLERALTEQEQDELSTLKSRVRGNRLALIEDLGVLLVASGGPLHVAAVASTLAGPTERILSEDGGLVPGGLWRASVLGMAWTQLGLMESDQSVWVVEDHLGGAMPLPDYALDSMVGLLPLNRPPGYEGVLDEILRSGSVAMKSRAITNPDWMDEARFRSEFTRLAEASRRGEGSRIEQGQVRLRLMSALAGRSDGAGRDLLLQTFEDGLWKPGSKGWGAHLPKGPWLTVLWAKLKPEERKDMVTRGLAPEGLFD